MSFDVHCMRTCSAAQDIAQGIVVMVSGDSNGQAIMAVSYPCRCKLTRLNATAMGDVVFDATSAACRKAQLSCTRWSRDILHEA